MEKKAILFVSIVSFCIAIVKLVVGILSNSVAVIASSIDSILDTLVSLFNLFAISKSKQPPSKQFNYGVGKIEGLASSIEGLVIFASGLYIIYASVQKYLQNDFTIELGYSIYIMIFSMFATLLIVLVLGKVYAKTKNLIIKTDMIHYKTDFYTNGGILISLVIIYFTDWYFVDALIGFLVGLYILYSATDLIKDGVYNLLDHTLENETIQAIQDIIDHNPHSNGYHLLRSRNSGGVNFVEFHLVLSFEIKLFEAYEVSQTIENEIKNLDKDKNWSITIRLDPYHDHEERLDAHRV